MLQYYSVHVAYANSNDVYFTFWPKEGSVAWFVAVRPSIMLLRRQEKKKHHSDTNNRMERYVRLKED